VATSQSEKITPSIPDEIIDQYQAMSSGSHPPQQGDCVRFIEMMKEERATENVIARRNSISQCIKYEEIHTGSMRGSPPLGMTNCLRADIAPIDIHIQTLGRRTSSQGDRRIATAGRQVENAKRTVIPLRQLC
jgi:hypothetical protein